MKHAWYLAAAVLILPAGVVSNAPRTAIVERNPADYRHVRAPSLIIAAAKTVDANYPWLRGAGHEAERARAQQYLDRVLNPWYAAGAARAQREIPHSRIVNLPGHHYIFVTQRQVRTRFYVPLRRASPVNFPARASYRPLNLTSARSIRYRASISYLEISIAMPGGLGACRSTICVSQQRDRSDSSVS